MNFLETQIENYHKKGWGSGVGNLFQIGLLMEKMKVLSEAVWI